jgi:hypothetical protein
MRLIANHSRVLDHHPEWPNVFNHVTVSLTTWDARRRVTIYDLNLALFMNKAVRAVMPRPDGVCELLTVRSLSVYGMARPSISAVET